MDRDRDRDREPDEPSESQETVDTEVDVESEATHSKGHASRSVPAQGGHTCVYGWSAWHWGHLNGLDDFSRTSLKPPHPWLNLTPLARLWSLWSQQLHAPWKYTSSYTPVVHSSGNSLGTSWQGAGSWMDASWGWTYTHTPEVRARVMAEWTPILLQWQTYIQATISSSSSSSAETETQTSVTMKSTLGWDSRACIGLSDVIGSALQPVYPIGRILPSNYVPALPYVSPVHQTFSPSGHLHVLRATLHRLPATHTTWGDISSETVAAVLTRHLSNGPRTCSGPHSAVTETTCALLSDAHPVICVQGMVWWMHDDDIWGIPHLSSLLACESETDDLVARITQLMCTPPPLLDVWEAASHNAMLALSSRDDRPVDGVTRTHWKRLLRLVFRPSACTPSSTLALACRIFNWDLLQRRLSHPWYMWLAAWMQQLARVRTPISLTSHFLVVWIDLFIKIFNSHSTFPTLDQPSVRALIDAVLPFYAAYFPGPVFVIQLAHAWWGLILPAWHIARALSESTLVARLGLNHCPECGENWTVDKLCTSNLSVCLFCTPPWECEPWTTWEPLFHLCYPT